MFKITILKTNILSTFGLQMTQNNNNNNNNNNFRTAVLV